jgi:hypothetical protein
MFDLEQAIAEWRRQMLAAGIESPVPLEELECHLREETGQQINSGLNEPAAFDSAVQKIGRAGALKHEFQKATTLSFEINRILAMAVGIAAIFSGLFQAWELVVGSRDLGKLPGDEVRLIGMFVLAFILAIAQVVLGLILALYGAGKISRLASAKPRRKYV